MKIKKTAFFVLLPVAFAFFLWSKTTSAGNTVPPVTKKVLLIIYDPILANGQRLHQARGWQDPKVLVPQIVSVLKKASGGYLNYQIAETLDYNEWPALMDGFRYTESTYNICMTSNNRSKDCHSPDGLDYNYVWSEANICSKVSSGQIDEVFIYGFPYEGADELALKIPGDKMPYDTPTNYWFYQGRKKNIPDCNGKTIWAMGFSYERGVAEAVHSYGHRAETALALTVGRGHWGDEANKKSACYGTSDWDKFSCIAKDISATSIIKVAGCGNVHFPPNGTADYDYANQTVKTDNCANWVNYPDLGQDTVSENCAAWGCSGDAHLQYLAWWFGHLPRQSGVNTNGNLRNWWKYIADFDNAVQEAKQPPPPGRSPVGNLDSIDSAGGVVSGWAEDPDKPGTPVYIHFYVDGPAGSTTGQFAGVILANWPRQGANNGFSYTLPNRLRDGAPHTLYAYGLDITGDQPALLGGIDPATGKRFTSTKPYSISSAVNTPIITVDKRDYKIGIDRNTGTIYQFFNKRSNAGLNTVQEHPGAALQTAVFQGPQYSLSKYPCAKQGYWNPTQAGAVCAEPHNIFHYAPIPGGDYHVSCDGNVNDLCTTASNTVVHDYYRMMNFDYGPGYPGPVPYNPADLLNLKQTITAYDNYTLVDLTVNNRGIVRDNVLFDMPIYYMDESYRRFYYQNGIDINQLDVPRQDKYEFRFPQQTTTGNFVTFEDANKPNSAITLAWYYSPEFAGDMFRELSWAGVRTGPPFEGKYWILFDNPPGLALKVNKEYRLRYVIIPYKYDEIITTEYGQMKVLDFIKRLSYPERSVSVTSYAAPKGGEYITPNYNKGPFIVSATNNYLLFGLTSGANYQDKQAAGFYYPAGNFLPPGKKIKGVEFDYETNFDNNNVFAAIDIPGSQFIWKEDTWGAKGVSKIRLDFPPSDFVGFGLYTKKGFSYQRPDNEWHFLIKNLKFYYYDDSQNNLPGDFNNDGKVDIDDYNKLVTEFGLPYTIFDYNILVENWGTHR
ncbi:MAG: hypothetical protein Q8P91_02230 [bacterium]|nr:hypothetical protein [bacterium]